MNNWADAIFVFIKNNWNWMFPIITFLTGYEVARKNWKIHQKIADRNVKSSEDIAAKERSVKFLNKELDELNRLLEQVKNLNISDKTNRDYRSVEKISDLKKKIGILLGIEAKQVLTDKVDQFIEIFRRFEKEGISNLEQRIKTNNVHAWIADLFHQLFETAEQAGVELEQKTEEVKRIDKLFEQLSSYAGGASEFYKSEVYLNFGKIHEPCLCIKIILETIPARNQEINLAGFLFAIPHLLDRLKLFSELEVEVRNFIPILERAILEQYDRAVKELKLLAH